MHLVPDDPVPPLREPSDTPGFMPFAAPHRFRLQFRKLFVIVPVLGLDHPAPDQKRGRTEIVCHGAEVVHSRVYGRCTYRSLSCPGQYFQDLFPGTAAEFSL